MGGGWLVEPNFRSLPLDVGGSAPAYLLSRPAQRSLTLWPAQIARPPKAAFITGLQSNQLPDQTAR